MIQITFDEAYVKYRSRIERYIQHQYGFSSHDAEEITAEVFIILISKWDEFDIHVESGVVKFLYRTAKNKAMEFLNKQKRRPNTCNLEEYLCLKSNDNNNDEFIYIDFETEEKRYHEYINEIKNILSPKERITFEYIVEKKYHPSQIAIELKTTEINIRVRWCRIRKKIENSLPTILGNQNINCL